MSSRKRRLSILFIADPLEHLKLESDSSLVMVRSFQRNGAQVYWTTPEQIFWNGLSPEVRALPLLPHEKGELPSRLQSQLRKMTDFHSIFIRKDPPFDAHYLRLCWMLAPLEKKTRLINRPSLLARYHEKMLPYEAYWAGALKSSDIIPMAIVTEIEQMRAFAKGNRAEKYILKPYLGYAGHRVQRGTIDELVVGADREGLKEPSIIQPYLSEVESTGDRRVLFWKGRYIGDVLRLPGAGGFVSNLAQGGKAIHAPLSKRDRTLIERLGRYLRKVGIDLAGADFLGGRINEVNVTSPTGFANIIDLEQRDVTEKIAKDLLK